MDKKLGQQPAFSGAGISYSNPQFSQPSKAYYKGMSKRFYAACAAIQGLISGIRANGDALPTKEIVEVAYEFADELLKQE